LHDQPSLSVQPGENMGQHKYILEESLGYAMSRATRTLTTLVNHNFIKAGVDVTCEQWSVLVNLGKKNGHRLRQDKINPGSLSS